MDKSDRDRIREEFKERLFDEDWAFDAPRYIRERCDDAPKEAVEQLRRELLATWFAWYAQWTLNNSPVFDP
jgi:hypothetical protein